MTKANYPQTVWEGAFVSVYTVTHGVREKSDGAGDICWIKGSRGRLRLDFATISHAEAIIKLIWLHHGVQIKGYSSMFKGFIGAEQQELAYLRDCVPAETLMNSSFPN